MYIYTYTYTYTYIYTYSLPPLVQVRYPATESALSPSLSGCHFLALFGAATPCLENLMIKRRLKGPCWTVLSAPTRVQYGDQVGGLCV
jgi:DNA polymerase alpha subunit A